MTKKFVFPESNTVVMEFIKDNKILHTYNYICFGGMTNENIKRERELSTKVKLYFRDVVSRETGSTELTDKYLKSLSNLRILRNTKVSFITDKEGLGSIVKKFYGLNKCSRVVVFEFNPKEISAIEAFFVGNMVRLISASVRILEDWYKYMEKCHHRRKFDMFLIATALPFDKMESMPYEEQNHFLIPKQTTTIKKQSIKEFHKLCDASPKWSIATYYRPLDGLGNFFVNTGEESPKEVNEYGRVYYPFKFRPSQTCIGYSKEAVLSFFSKDNFFKYSGVKL